MFCMNRVFRRSNTVTNLSGGGFRHWNLTECELQAFSISCLDRESPVRSSFIDYTRKQYTDWMRLAQVSVQCWGDCEQVKDF